MRTKAELKTAIDAMNDDQLTLVAPRIEVLTTELVHPEPLGSQWTEAEVLAEREADDNRPRYVSELLPLSRLFYLFGNSGIASLIMEPDNKELWEARSPASRLDMYYGCAKTLLSRRETMTEDDLDVVNSPDYDRLEDVVFAHIGAYSLERTVYGDHDDGKYLNPDALCRRVEEYLNAVCRSITGWPCINIYEGLTYNKAWNTYPPLPGEPAPVIEKSSQEDAPQLVAESSGSAPLPASKPSIEVLKSFEDDEIRDEAVARGIIEVKPTISETPGFIEVPGMEAPWVLGGLKWDGKSEVADESELTDFLGFNPNGKTGGKSWCAGFWNSVFKTLGFDVSDLDLRAASYEGFGYELEIDHDVHVDTLMESIPDGAILVFQPDPDGEFPISHVGVKVDGEKLFGGNQGDKAKRSNLLWYLQHAELTAVRCADGYKLV